MWRVSGPSLDVHVTSSGVGSNRGMELATPSPEPASQNAQSISCGLCVRVSRARAFDFTRDSVACRSHSSSPTTAGTGGTSLDGATASAAVIAHARFLQHIFRNSTRLRPGCWRPGGLSRLAVWRPVPSPSCGHGVALSPEADFIAQRERARACADWYKQYVWLLKRFASGRTPLVLDLFCSAGGATEGFRRGGAAVVGMDHDDQPSWCARFGEESFILGDALDLGKLRDLVRRLQPAMIWASPHCQGYSSAPRVGAPSRVERQISLVRDVLTALGLPFVIENVTGARRDMSSDALSVWGQLFGLHQDRERLLEGGGGLTLRHEEALRVPGAALRRGSCLGRRRRFPKRDWFGRAIRPTGPRACCDGNIYATQGSSSHFGSTREHALSMGLDPGHMAYSELSQAVPPDYASFALGQAAMHILRAQYGLPALSFDEMLADPTRARSMMRLWIRGAGGTSPSLGLAFEPSGAASGPRARHASSGSESDPGPGDWRGDTPSPAAATDVDIWASEPGRAGVSSAQEVALPGLASSLWSLDDADFRELEYSHAGSYEQVVIHGGAPNWSARMRPCRRLARSSLQSGRLLRGFNTFVHLPGEGERAAVAELCRLAPGDLDGGRVTVLVDSRWVGKLEAAGFRRVMSWRPDEARVLGEDREVCRLHRAVVAMSLGRRECPRGGLFLDHSAVESFLDPRDRGAPSGSRDAKAALAWSPLVRHPDRWRGKGLPPDVERMMTHGVVVDALGDDQLMAKEVGQYAFQDTEHFVRGSQECDRALLAGHLEAVPAAEVEWALAHGSVHPWTVVHQSADKWRSCQDYKLGTNTRVISTPFTLCRASEVSRVVKQDSHFAKFDLRDGFWSCPVAEASRHHLMVRHPATGALLRCTSLPFGYARSPEHFCRVTEAVAQLFRQRVAGMGIHVFCFVDDYLLVGDTRELTVLAMQMFMDLLNELGLPFAPHKTRGPARVMEFLGFLLSNVEGYRCMSLTASRQEKVETLLRGWADWEPPPGRPPGTAEPRELAQLLGQLVFVSDAIPGGRVYMQAMLQQFKGLQVDWARGLVRHVHSDWQRVTLRDGFWRDLHWWRSALRRQNCVPFEVPRVGDLAIVGTDASDLACGELVWLDGAREEVTLLFTVAERRRPINWRELRGTLRALEVWGARLAGRLILIETDNTFGHESARKLYSKSEDAQELIRRIHHLSLRHGFSLRSVHTPGVMLVRPDQTSRGAPPEEPRLRVRVDAFRALERRFGPFDEMLGTERELQGLSVEGDSPFSRLWAHPTYDTVGSTLRMICERLTTDSRTCPRGVVIVPFAPEAGWWRLTRHFACVGGWECGRLGLEANALGVWKPTSNQRPTLVLSFPRAGSLLVPLSAAVTLGTASAREELRTASPFMEAGVFHRIQRAWVNTASELPEGTLLYQPRRFTPTELRQHAARGIPGVLYLTVESFGGEPGGVVPCAELLRMGAASHRHHFVLDRGSYDRNGAPYAPDVCSLWVVNHLGGRLHTQPAQARRGGGSTRFFFDFDRAEDEVAHMRAALCEAEATGLLSSGESAADELGFLVDLRIGRGIQPPPPPSPSGGSEGRDDEWDPLDDIDDELTPVSGYGESRSAWVTSRAGQDGAASPRAQSRRAGPAPAAGITAPSRCHYAAMPCRGCMQPLGLGTWCIPGGVGMVHNTTSCYQIACERRVQSEADTFEGERARLRTAREPLAAEGSAAEVLPVGQLVGADLARSSRDRPLDESIPGRPPLPAASQRGTQLMESLSDDRRAMIRLCIAGQCEHANSDEPRMTCIGACHRQLHGVRCAQLSSGHAVIGCFECPDCQLRPIFGRPPPYPEAALRDAEETMILTLSRGAESTGGVVADYVRLEAAWVLEAGGGEPIAHPSDSPAAFKLFLTWVLRQQDRPRSLPTLWRVSGSYMIRTGRPNLTSNSDVKAHYSSLIDLHGVEGQPRTAATPRMAFHMFDSVIEVHCPRPFIRSRTGLDFCLEAGCGVRVGEAMTGGDFHGMKANHLCILRRVDSGLVTIEGMLDHSKTGFKRYVNCLGTTLGTAVLPFEKCLREYWRLAGLRVVSWTEGGYEVTSVDYSVIRVSFLGLSADRFAALLRLLPISSVPEVRAAAASLAGRARTRYDAKGSKEKRYINLLGGGHDDPRMHRLTRELAEAGFGATGHPGGCVSVGLGPLLRSTDGDRVSHMPLDPSATYATLHRIFDDAYDLANPEGDPDPWLDMQGMDEPLWGHHSFRRMADTVARATMERTGATEQDIDLIFGWNEKMYSHKMQCHYETRFNRDRRYRVTMYL